MGTGIAEGFEFITHEPHPSKYGLFASCQLMTVNGESAETILQS
jgi:hypothetical protein